jgi:nucleoside-diphosphate-sugar epimerase
MRSAGVALLTGATGFLGSRLVKRLLDDGFEVRALSSGTARDRLANLGSRVGWYGLSDDDVAQATRGVDLFFNLAVAYDRPAFGQAHIDFVNVVLPLRVIAALNARDRSAACVLGDSFFRKFPISATAQPRYTASKLEMARRVNALPAGGPCRVAMLMIEQVYGPGDNLDKIFPRITRQLLQHAPRIALTPGDQRRDFIHIDDIIDAAMVVGRDLPPGRVTIECGSGESTPVRDVFERLKSLTGSSSELGFGDMPHDQTIPNSTGDVAWLIEHGWRCKISLDHGLRELVADVIQRSSV